MASSDIPRVRKKVIPGRGVVFIGQRVATIIIKHLLLIKPCSLSFAYLILHTHLSNPVKLV